MRKGCEILDRTIRTIQKEIVKKATSYQTGDDNVIIPFGKSEYIKDKDTAYHVANNKQIKINEDYNAKVFGTVVTMYDLGNRGYELKITPPKPLLDALEKNEILAEIAKEEAKNKPKPGEQGELFQLEAKDSPIQALNNLINIWLTKAGIKVDIVDELKTNKGLDAIAVADVLNKLIKVAKGKEGKDTLAEEAGHMLTLMLGKDHPLVQKMLALIEQTEVYQPTYDEYFDAYNGDIDRIKMEAVGKMIAKMTIQKFERNEFNTTNKTVWDKFKQLVNAMFKWLENKFKNVPDTFEQEVDKVYGEAAKRILTDDVSGLKETKIKEGVEFVFKENPELSQIGTQEQYSQYLDTVFPNSQVKDIVYHGSKREIIGNFKSSPYYTGFYFTDKKENAKEHIIRKQKLGEDKTEYIYPAILNLKSPVTTSNKTYEEVDELAKMTKGDEIFGGDSIIANSVLEVTNDGKAERLENQFVVFEPEQIHILGSKQDIEGFKEFVESQQYFQLDSDKKKYGDFVVNQGFPMQVSNLEKIEFGQKRLTVRPNNYKEGVYKFGNWFYAIRKIKQDKAYVSEYKSGDFLKEKAFGTEEIQYKHIQDFFDGKRPMYVYQIQKLNSDIQMLYKEADKPENKKYKDPIEEYIQRFQTRITRIKNQNPNWRTDAKVSAVIKKLELDIKRLEEDRSVSILETKAANELKLIEDKLKEFDTIAEKEEFYTYAMEVLKGWSDLANFINYDSEEDQNKVNALSGKAKKLQDKVTNIYQEWLSENDDMDYMSSTVDESFFGANFLDIAQSNNPILRKIGEIVNKAKFVAYDLFNKLSRDTDEKYEKVLDWAKANNKSEKEVWELFAQKDSKGNKTGNFVVETSQAYYDKKEEMAAKAKKSGDWKNFSVWMKANTTKTFDKAGFEAMYNAVRQQLTDTKGNVDEAALEAWVKENNEDNYKSQFVISSPNKELWKDKDYEYIQSQPALKEFYKHFTDTLAERTDVLPKYYYNQSNYLPELKKDVLFDLSKGGMVGMASDWGKRFKDMFTTNVEGTSETVLRDPITGEPEQTIPVYMMSNSLNPDEKEYNLAKVLKAFGAMSYLYEQKSAVEEPVKLRASIFKQLKEKLIAEGVEKRDRYGKLVEVLDGNKQAIDLMEYYIDATLYDKTKGQDAEITLATTEDGKKVTTTTVLDQIINYTRLKGLAFNPFAGLTNLIFGLSSNFIYAEGKTDFTPKQSMDAFGEMLNSLIKGSDTNKKVNFLFEKFRIKPEYVSSEGNRVGKYAYMLTEAGEFMNYGQSGIATLMNTPIQNKKGETKSLYDAYIVKDGKVVWNTEEFGEEQYLDTSEEKYNVYAKIQEVNKRVHGNYDPDSPTLIKKSVWGRALMIFRTWLPMAIYTRFGKETQSDRLGRTVKGRYISGWEYLKDAKAHAILPVLQELMYQVVNTATLNRLELESGAFDKLSELDKENMLRNVAELRFILFFTTLGLVLRGMTIDDDDEEKVALWKFMINQSDRVGGELKFFFSPADQSRIIRDISPVSKTVADFYDLVPAAGRFIMGEDELKGGPAKGKSNFMRQLKQAVPVITQIQKVEELAERNIENPMFR